MEFELSEPFLPPITSTPFRDPSPDHQVSSPSSVQNDPLVRDDATAEMIPQPQGDEEYSSVFQLELYNSPARIPETPLSTDETLQDGHWYPLQNGAPSIVEIRRYRVNFIDDPQLPTLSGNRLDYSLVSPTLALRQRVPTDNDDLQFFLSSNDQEDSFESPLLNEF